MKPVKLFYQERCPFCKKALRYIEELKAEYPEFQPIEIEMIEETQHPDIAEPIRLLLRSHVLCGRGESA